MQEAHIKIDIRPKQVRHHSKNTRLSNQIKPGVADQRGIYYLDHSVWIERVEMLVWFRQRSMKVNSRMTMPRQANKLVDHFPHSSDLLFREEVENYVAIALKRRCVVFPGTLHKLSPSALSYSHGLESVCRASVLYKYSLHIVQITKLIYSLYIVTAFQRVGCL